MNVNYEQFEQVSRIIGVVSIGLLFAVKFYIATTTKLPKVPDFRMMETLRIGVLWTSIYVFFLFVLQLLSFFNIGTMQDRRIISSWSSLVPLVAIGIHWYLSKKMLDHQEKVQDRQQMQELKEEFQKVKEP